MLKTAISLPYPEFEFNEFEQVFLIRQKPVSIERRLKSWNIEYNFK